MKTLIIDDMKVAWGVDVECWYKCPVCKGDLITSFMNYCPNCGINITFNKEEAMKNTKICCWEDIDFSKCDKEEIMEDTKLDYGPEYEDLYVENCECGEIIEIICEKAICYKMFIRVRCPNCGEFVEVIIKVD